MITDYKYKYFFFNVIEYEYKYFANVFKYILIMQMYSNTFWLLLITLSWNENRKAASVSFVAALMHCWGMSILIPIVYDFADHLITLRPIFFSS